MFFDASLIEKDKSIIIKKTGMLTYSSGGVSQRKEEVNLRKGIRK